MSAWETIFHDLASREYRKALDRYRGYSPRVFERFLKAVSDAMVKIEDDPNQWPIFREPYRWVKLQKFPYVIYFRVYSSDVVRIMAFAHSQRRPGYWMRRK
jgi:toxin ParE1/3/4